MCCNDTMCNDYDYEEIDRLQYNFPFLQKEVIWFDNSATTHKPETVIKSIKDFYTNKNSNIHRGSHKYANEATRLYELARDRCKKYLNTDNIIFTRGTTEGINLLANVLPIHYGDTILLSEMEHHSNIVPWQMIAKKVYANIDYIRIKDNGELDLIDLYKKMQNNVKVISITHVSNVLGTVNNVKNIIKCIKKFNNNIYTVIDGAQALGHMKVDINDIDCDFYVSSCHKMFGPFGVGLLCTKKNIMDNLPPWQGGGGMIKDVTFESTIYSDENKYEAGTPNVCDVIALNGMLDFLESLNWLNIEKYEKNLLLYTIKKMNEIDDLIILGNSDTRISVISFVVKNKNLHDIAKKLDEKNVILRVGHHCSQPTIRHYGYEETLRISLCLYNTFYDVDMFIIRLKESI